MLSISSAQLSTVIQMLESLGRGQRVTVELLISMEKAMAGELEKLRQEVAEAKSVTEGAVALMNDMAARMKDAVASGDMSEVAKLADDLSANTDALATAIAANTMQAPAPEVVQEPAPVTTESAPPASEPQA